MAWLEEATEMVAAAAGIDASTLELPAEVRDEILDLARIASHSSGDRINAPLLCYVLGMAVAKGGDLGTLARALRA